MGNIEQFLADNEKKGLLRFSTAGSIDDGKSTLIGRLLHDSKNVYEDQVAAVKRVSREKSSVEGLDFALITDGLRAEREQGITIDVAYRYFSTPMRKFIIADTPGHVQYTRNMATGASTADLAVVLIDARNGVLAQTKRHAFISSLLGVPHMIVAINKMDLVDYSEKVFEEIKRDFVGFADRLEVSDLRFIPISALAGDNVIERSDRMPWYKGQPFLEILETVYIGSDRNLIDLRFPVQYVLRPDLSFRGYCGQVASGVLRKGDEITVLPSMKTSRVRSIATYDGELDYAFPPMAVTVTLEDDIDVSRGDMLVHPANVPTVARGFEAMVVWMSEMEMDLNRPYLIKQTSQSGKLRIGGVRYKVDVNTLKRADPGPLSLNEIGRVAFTATRPIFYDAYQKNRLTGSFILIDEATNSTVAAGMIIDRAPSGQIPVNIARNQNRVSLLHKRESLISHTERVDRMGQEPATVWLTGLVGSGKTAVAYALEERLFKLGATSVVLDGENIRLGVSRDLDFSSAGRAEHLRRVAEISRLLNGSGIIAICGFVSPTAATREQVSEIIGKDKFIEIHVDAPVEWCEERDASGLYAKGRAREVKNVAGVDSPYEAPKDPALVLRMNEIDVDEAADKVLALMRDRGILK